MTPQSEPVQKNDEYTCAYCGGEFIATRNHDEVSAECKEYFGTTPDETDCDIVCDDCWKRIVEQ